MTLEKDCNMWPCYFSLQSMTAGTVGDERRKDHTTVAFAVNFCE